VPTGSDSKIKLCQNIATEGIPAYSNCSMCLQCLHINCYYSQTVLLIYGFNVKQFLHSYPFCICYQISACQW